MKILTPEFWKDAAERSVATAAQATLAAIAVDKVSAFDLNYKNLAGIAAGGALLALLKAVAVSARTGGDE